MPLPISQLIVEALEAALLDITEANGFETNIIAVYPTLEIPDDPTIATPCVFIDDNDLSFSEEVNNRSSNELSIRLGLALQSGGDVRRALSYFVADVRKQLHVQFEAVSETPSAGHFAGLPVWNLRFNGARRQRATIPGGADIRIVVLGVSIDFKDLIDDPYTGG